MENNLEAEKNPEGSRKVDMIRLPEWYQIDKKFQDIALTIRTVNARLDGVLHLPFLYQQKAIDADINKDVHEEMCRNPALVHTKMNFLQPLHLPIFEEFFKELQKESSFLRVSRKNDEREKYLGYLQFEDFFRTFASAEIPGLGRKYATNIIENDLTNEKYKVILKDPNRLSEFVPFLSDEDNKVVLDAFKLQHKEQAIQYCEDFLWFLENLQLRDKYLNHVIENKLYNSKWSKILEGTVPEAETYLHFLEPGDKSVVVAALADKKKFQQELNSDDFGIENRHRKLLNIVKFAALEKYKGKIMVQKLDNAAFNNMLSQSLEQIRKIILPVFCKIHPQELCNCQDPKHINVNDALNILSKVFSVKKSQGRNLLAEITCSEIEKNFGHGAFGIIDRTSFQIREDNVFAVVAIKRYESVFGSSKEKIKEELNTISGLSHRNVLFEWGYISESDNHIPMLVMNYVNYGTLRDFIKDEIRINRLNMLTPDFCRLIFTLAKLSFDICNGMDYLHRNRIVHRDLKLDNILITFVSNAVIADFGMSRQIREEQGDTISQNYPATRFYMAPETIDEKTFSFKSDVWSVGVVLNLLWGLNADDSFEADGDGNMINFSSSCNPQMLEELPPQLCTIMDSIFEYEPTRRPTMDILKFEFNTFLKFPENEDDLDKILKVDTVEEYLKIRESPTITRVSTAHGSILDIAKKCGMNTEQERLFGLLGAHQLEFNSYCCLRDMLRNF